MCGVVGVVAFDPDFDDAASWLSWALVEQEHRGKEASGIYTNKSSYKNKGTPEQVFSKKRLEDLGGYIGLGHVLYTTSGKTLDDGSVRMRAQPFLANLGGDRKKPIAFSFNGNLVNWQKLREECRERGYAKPIINDTGVIAALIELASGKALEEALINEVLPRLEWSFSIIFYDKALGVLYGARDPRGFMPLVLGRRNDEFLVVASEDCVFAEGGFGCERIGEVPPGSMVKLDPKSHEPFSVTVWAKSVPARHCIFHWIYFNRPDGTFCGKNVKTTQEKAGELLAKIHPFLHADVIIPVSDSGLAAAQGYAKVMTEKTGRWLFDTFGLFRPHTVGRTFMEPHQHLREEGVGKKHRVIEEVVKGKVVVLVDDSLVRGTTMKRLVKRLFEIGGAKEVHVRIASPPIKEICVHGIDMPTHKELAWNRCHQSKEEACRLIGATSLEYLDGDGSIKHNIQAILQTPSRYPNSLDEDSFCTQCFTGINAIK